MSRPNLILQLVKKCSNLLEGSRLFFLGSRLSKDLQTVRMEARNIPETKHLRIWERIRRDWTQGKQKRKFLGGGPRREEREPDERELREVPVVAAASLELEFELDSACLRRRRSRRSLRSA